MASDISAFEQAYAADDYDVLEAARDAAVLAGAVDVLVDLLVAAPSSFDDDALFWGIVHCAEQMPAKDCAAFYAGTLSKTRNPFWESSLVVRVANGANAKSEFAQSVYREFVDLKTASLEVAKRFRKALLLAEQEFPALESFKWE